MNSLLHTLRCIGFAKLDRIAKIAALPEPEAESELIDLAVDGLVTRLPGEFGGWGLTDRGKKAAAEQAAAELDATGARARVLLVFDEFLVLNPELLDLCTAWQLRSDGAKVLALFADFDRRATAVIADLTAVLPRFGRYRERLSVALKLALDGRTEYLTDEMESYHAIWFQLHEDLLVTLGIPR
ncbi:transcriptional regulator [Nonomuraea sp. NPDC050663]|uniref:transcriptional regulator n=1 Tax=Nonomuraea sp. NPDC050663 TaxID=3364370 RepID=UPI0037AD1834